MKKINLNARGAYGSAKDKALTPTQRVSIYKNISDKTNKVIFVLGAYAGMRVGEIEQCRKEWLSREYIAEQEILAITIPNECRNVKNKKSIWRPKTKRGRTTYIFDKDKWLEVESYFESNEFIPLTTRSMQNRCYNMTGISIHSLRATAQNYFKYELQLIPEVIASMLGHRDVRTTMQHYNTMNRSQTESYFEQKLKNDTKNT